MFLKILVALVTILVLWMVMFRGLRGIVPGARQRGADKAPRRRHPVTKTLVKCRDCGVYLPADQACDCRNSD